MMARQLQPLQTGVWEKFSVPPRRGRDADIAGERECAAARLR
jgi:hypothetical protein